jgi:hypothetical protein
MQRQRAPLGPVGGGYHLTKRDGSNLSGRAFIEAGAFVSISTLLATPLSASDD